MGAAPKGAKLLVTGNGCDTETHPFVHEGTESGLWSQTSGLKSAFWDGNWVERPGYRTCKHVQSSANNLDKLDGMGKF